MLRRTRLAWRVGAGLLAVLLGAQSAPASESRFHLGLIGGLNRAGLSGESLSDTDLDTKTGFLVGATIGLELRDAVTLSLEPSYVARGCRVVVEIDDRNDIEEDTSVALDYLELPLLVRARGSGKTRPFAVGGLGVAFLLDATGEPPNGGTVDLADDVKSTDVLAYFGGGVEADWGGHQVFFEGRYSQGLGNAGRGNQASAVSLPPEFKNTALQLVAGWKLWP